MFERISKMEAASGVPVWLGFEPEMPDAPKGNPANWKPRDWERMERVDAADALGVGINWKEF